MITARDCDLYIPLCRRQALVCLAGTVAVFAAGGAALYFGQGWGQPAFVSLGTTAIGTTALLPLYRAYKFNTGLNLLSRVKPMLEKGVALSPLTDDLLTKTIMGLYA